MAQYIYFDGKDKAKALACELKKVISVDADIRPKADSLSVFFEIGALRYHAYMSDDYCEISNAGVCVYRDYLGIDTTKEMFDDMILRLSSKLVEIVKGVNG